MGQSGSIMAKQSDLSKDLTGKVVVVTGGNSGIGLSTVTQLSSQGASVVMCCRSLEKGQAKAKIIADKKVKGTVEPMQLDLNSLQSVRQFVEAFDKKFDRCDFLVNNAGVMNPPKGYTKDGFETQIGVNHLGHFLLTELMMPKLKASAPARVVVLSSCASYGLQGFVGDIDFKDMMYKERKYNGWEAYCQSKFANLLHARELARRYGSSGITAVSVHPGFVESNLTRHTTGEQGGILASLGNMAFKGTMGMINPWQGVQASLHAILSDESSEHNGQFFSQAYSPSNQYPKKQDCKGGWLEPPPNPKAMDAKLAERLWDFSMEAVGLSASGGKDKSAASSPASSDSAPAASGAPASSD